MNSKVISITIFFLLFILTIFFIRTELYYKHYRFENLIKENKYKYSNSFQLKINGQLVNCKDSTCEELVVIEATTGSVNNLPDIQNDYLNILNRYTDINMVMEGTVEDSTLTIDSEWFTILMTFREENGIIVIKEIRIDDVEMPCVE